ncbi:MAG TPA: RodZ domain-containing protein [bacterium]|nr:RodZ domain-containing protein [bacterium]
MPDDRPGLGESLRRAREARGLSLAQAERLTKIRAVYLDALEEERFATLPPRPYAKGFVRIYAAALGLDPGALLDAFDAHLPAVAPTPLSQAAEIPLEPPAPPSRLRRLVTMALWILIPVVIALAVVLYVNVRDFVRTGPRAASSPSPAPAPASPPPSVLPGAVPLPAASPSPAATPVPPAPQAVEGIAVALAVTEESWLRVTVDGRRIFQGLMYPGDTATWTAQRELEVRIGNAGGVTLIVNGRDLGLAGRPRQVVTRRFTVTPEEP